MKLAFKMKLKPGNETEYQKRHSPIWPDLKELLESHGVSSYSIFLDESECTLFAYAEIQDLDQWESIADSPVCRKWWDYMAPLMEVNDDNSPKTDSLKQVFELGQTGFFT